MGNLLYPIISWITRIHHKILSLNDSKELYFNDKELHFLVIGLLGMALIFVVYPIFKALVKRGYIMTVTWIYVFTVLIVITFAIEIGQWYTGSGVVELADVTSGLAGFLVMFIVFAIIRKAWHAVRKLFRK
ncbi:MAG: hypothetical protein GX083_01630 [Clostridiales bacterium]|nr:hypothetical protein [Clostridiales bacterium]